MRVLRTVSLLFVMACSGSGGADEPLGDGHDSSSIDDSSGFRVDSLAETEGGPSCIPPDMMIALDRTLTMHFQPDGTDPIDAPTYASSKWSQAITVINALAAPPLDQTIRFGLELWPKEEPGCITLAERVKNTKPATNPQCEAGEVLVSPALGAGSAIHGLLDPAKTKICISTPTGSGLITAADALHALKEVGRDQYIILVTDGADWDVSCPAPNPLLITQQNAANGIKTFVVGFSAAKDLGTGGVGVPFLNNMACGGKTAIDFEKNCATDSTGKSSAIDAANGPVLFLRAEDRAALAASLGKATKAICCACVK